MVCRLKGTNCAEAINGVSSDAYMYCQFFIGPLFLTMGSSINHVDRFREFLTPPPLSTVNVVYGWPLLETDSKEKTLHLWGMISLS